MSAEIAGVTSAIRAAVPSRTFRMTAPPRSDEGIMQGACVERCSSSATWAWSFERANERSVPAELPIKISNPHHHTLKAA
jgi:hypothetical protein